jgi:hypothetical protein
MNHQYEAILRHARHAAFAAAFMTLAGCGSEGIAPAPESGPKTQQSSANHPPPPPPRPTTKEACDACQGLWAVHGISPVESCICLTEDAGQRCLDGNECVGQCLVERDAEFQIMEAGDPPRGFYAGTCSTYDTPFGCHLVIPTGTEARLPLTADEAALRLCID